MLGAAALAVGSAAQADGIGFEYNLGFGGKTNTQEFNYVVDVNNKYSMNNNNKISVPLYTTNSDKLGILNAAPEGSAAVGWSTTTKVLIGAAIVGGIYAITKKDDDTTDDSSGGSGGSGF